MVYSDQTANEARPVDIAKVKEARPAVSKNTLDEIWWPFELDTTRHENCKPNLMIRLWGY